MAPRKLLPRLRRAPLVLGLALGAAGLAQAVASTLFDLKPEATDRVVVRGDAPSPTEVAARVVALEGAFPAGREVRVWASERVEFLPGFGAKDAKISWHVGPAPAPKGLAKQTLNVALPTALSAQASASRGNLLLRYALPGKENLSVRIVNVSGKTVFAQTLGPRAAGRHSETLTLPSLKDGVYVVRLEAGKKAVSLRMLLGTR